MDDKILFKESQRFLTAVKWVWIIMLTLCGLFLFAVVKQVILDQPLGQKPMRNVGLILTTLITILVTWILWFLRLDTVITDRYIKVRFFPFHWKYKVFPWDKISKCYLRTYQPVKEFGGWGIRRGIGKAGKAWNVSGNKGMQIEFHSGKKIIIGTKKLEQLESVLTDMGKLTPGDKQ